MDPRSTAAVRLKWGQSFRVYYSRTQVGPLLTQVGPLLAAPARQRSAVQHLRPGQRVGAPRTRSVTQVYVGFLGSRGGHAAVSHFLGAKSMAVFLNATLP